MVSVKVREGESFEYAVRKFKRLIDKAGLQKIWREKEHFIKPAERKQERLKAARKRLAKKQAKDRSLLSKNPNKGAGRRRPARRNLEVVKPEENSSD